MSHNLGLHKEQAFFLIADAIQEGRFTTVITAQNAQVYQDTAALPPIINEDWKPPRQRLTESQLTHLGTLATSISNKSSAKAGSVSESAIGQLNCRLQKRYGAQSTEQAMRMAIEHRDLGIDLIGPKDISILGKYAERQLALCGLLSHGLSVIELTKTLGISPRQIGNHLAELRINLGATTNPGAVYTAFQLGLMDSEGTWPLRTVLINHKVRAKPLSKYGIMPRLHRIFSAAW